MTNVKSIIKISSLIAIVLFILVYSGFEARRLVRGPHVEIFEPSDGATIENPLVEVRGRAENVLAISLNDRKITVDEQGVFSEKLLLSPGYNVIRVSVSDKFGRNREKTVELVLTQHESLVSLPSQELN